jgi:ATP-dependent phosphoenolpyruvate carboxykinase
MLQSEATLIDERKESIGTFKLEQHQLTVGDVHHDLPPSSCAAYDTAAKKLVDLFRGNFKKYESGVGAESKAAGPA